MHECRSRHQLAPVLRQSVLVLSLMDRVKNRPLSISSETIYRWKECIRLEYSILRIFSSDANYTTMLPHYRTREIHLHGQSDSEDSAEFLSLSQVIKTEIN